MFKDINYIIESNHIDHSKTNETLLWESLKDGSRNAMEVLFKLYYFQLYDYGIKITKQDELVKDCVQDTFFYLWNKRYQLTTVNSVKAYLMTCVRRNIFKALKKQERRRQLLNLFANEKTDVQSSFEELMILKELEQDQQLSMKAAFLELPERQREALYLKNNQELSYKEISTIMKISPQVARNYVSEAYKKLRQILNSPINK